MVAISQEKIHQPPFLDVTKVIYHKTVAVAKLRIVAFHYKVEFIVYVHIDTSIQD